MAKIIAIGDAVNDEERKAIAWLKEKLPDDYYVIHSFEIEQYDQLFEVDICVVAPHAIYLIDAKGVHGFVEVDGNTWHTPRSNYRSPMPKLRGNAKSLSGLISKQNRANRELGNLYVDTAVLLTIDDCEFIDKEDRERGQVVALKSSTRFFTDSSRIPDRFSRNVLKYITVIAEALGKSAKRRDHGERFGNWEVAEQLQQTEHFIEYRVFNVTAGRKGGTALAKAYLADPYLPEEEREKQKRLLENAYRALMRMPGHSAIVGARDFFSNESQNKYILLTDDIPGEVLAEHISNSRKALTLDQKKRVVRDILSALQHMCAHGVVHRNITPDHIVLGMDGQPRLIDFDFARIAAEQTSTIADEIQDRLSNRYKAPELWADNHAASCASDMYSFALVVYELFTGEAAFDSVTQALEKSCVFRKEASELNRQLPSEFDGWLDKLKAKDVSERFTAQEAIEAFGGIWKSKPKAEAQIKEPIVATKPPAIATKPINYKCLDAGFALTQKYIVQQPLGKPGGFGIVYKVIDTLGDVPRAIKLILQDRESVLERLKQEYRTLLKLPPHPYVVKVYDADVLPNDGPPYIVFEYLEGHDVSELISNHSLTNFEVWTMAKQVAEGLAHLHRHDVFHCDIKPQNLIWKDGTVRIIDFNVSVEAEDLSHGGGSRKYLPPDLEITYQPQASDLIDRDLYALGITLYRAMTGQYPWKDSQFPPHGVEGRDPTEFSQSIYLSDEVCSLLLKLIAPKRVDRFDNAEELLAAIKHITQLNKPAPKEEESTSQFSLPRLADGSMPSKNAFHDYLLTLYSQSRHSNSGTRGLDDYARLIYVDTALDTKLAPAVMSGELKLVVITGNAGDGKTAFLQQLEREAKQRGITVNLNPEGNGANFELEGHRFISNYDGSQDEGNTNNDLVLERFFSPFVGDDDSVWPKHETRLIAINEGRLVDFMASHGEQFSALRTLLDSGLKDSKVQAQVAVVNLNLRDVLAGDNNDSIFERLIARMVDKKVWQGCDFCGLKDKCYVRYNVATLQDQQSSPKVIQRLKYLYSLASLRNSLHITLRDLRSALAYTLVGGNSCTEIHELYFADKADEILKGYYFNSWRGNGESEDRLLRILNELDVAESGNVRLDRSLDFLGADFVDWLSFEDRGNYAIQLLQKMHAELPTETSLSAGTNRYSCHQAFVGMLRRKVFFELRGDDWVGMPIYRSAMKLLELLKPGADLDKAKKDVILAINRGEGLYTPDVFDGQLAMQVRKIERGSIKSFRVFPADVFTMAVEDVAVDASFIERRPSRLYLSYHGDGGLHAELDLNLDLFEMLDRLNEGYIPSVEELQGYYLSLTVFKNVLASAPYREVLLTTNGRQYQTILREEDGTLVLKQLEGAQA